MSDNEQRSPKRLKLSSRTDYSENSIKHSSTSSISRTGADSSSKSRRQQGSQPNRKQKGRNSETKNGSARPQPVFSQPSTISAGDRGIFVTSDKGREKKCLLELQDILQDLLGDGHGSDADRPVTSNSPGNQTSIENDIENELAEMRGQVGTETKARSSNSCMSLITLDIPCVSFVRFSPDIKRDPVELVHTICASAARGTNSQRSRYIKRLTPISMLGKALSNGLETICESVLPEHFDSSRLSHASGIKYAIKPTIRNNDKLNREVVIKTVADYVHQIGEGKPKVDLKGYERGILVEVYRGWVGICVVDNTPEANADVGGERLGYEALRRYNLAEIYVDAQRGKDGL